jgi:hypothetical protein
MKSYGLALGTRRHRAALGLFLISLSATLGAQPSPAGRTQKISIEKLVKALGSDDTDLARIRLLAREPVRSTRLLIAELHPVPGVRILPNERGTNWKDTWHVIWCLRALRYLTGGLEFRAKTAYHFGDGQIEQRRKWFVGGEEFSKDGTVRFFGVWMSRDSTYIAPRDAQAGIIRKWKAWYEQHGTTFSYVGAKAQESPDVWYF